MCYNITSAAAALDPLANLAKYAMDKKVTAD
jgi:hypothetical protein